MKLLASLLLCLFISTCVCAQAAPRVLTWSPKAEFADSYIQDGATIRIIRDNGLTIAVVGYDAKDHVVCEVAVVNESDRRVDVVPSSFFLSYTDNKGKYQHLSILPGTELAKKYANRAKWGGFFRTFAAGMATTTSNVSSAGTVYDNQGRLGTYESTGTVTSPNAAAQRNAAAANERASENARTKGEAITSRELLANTLFPKQYIQGSVYFKRKKTDTAILFVVIDGTGYAFKFTAIK